MTFNEKLVTLRKDSGMSQDALAEKLGVSRQAVSKWENGTAMPETENIIKIAKIFCVETDWLLEHKVLAKPKIEINRQKTIRTVCFIIYILLVGFMLLCLMIFTMNMADGVVNIIRPFSWLKIEEYFQLHAWYSGYRCMLFAIKFLLPAGISFALMNFIRKKDGEYDIRE